MTAARTLVPSLAGVENPSTTLRTSSCGRYLESGPVGGGGQARFIGRGSVARVLHTRAAWLRSLSTTGAACPQRLGKAAPRDRPSALQSRFCSSKKVPSTSPGMGQRPTSPPESTTLWGQCTTERPFFATLPHRALHHLETKSSMPTPVPPHNPLRHRSAPGLSKTLTRAIPCADPAPRTTFVKRQGAC
jgi:hypothetical protein